MLKSQKVFLIFLFIGFQLVAQNKENRWVVGASVGVAKFASKDVGFIGDQFNFQIPRLNVSRYFFKGLTLDAGLSFNTIDEISGVYNNSIPYFSLDGAVRYDFGTSNDNLVPYMLLGGSIVKTNRKTTPTLNIGAGGTFWLNARYGVNVELLHKYSHASFESMRSHTYFSVGIVYSFKLRTLVPRLWDVRGR